MVLKWTSGWKVLLLLPETTQKRKNGLKGEDKGSDSGLLGTGRRRTVEASWWRETGRRPRLLPASYGRRAGTIVLPL